MTLVWQCNKKTIAKDPFDQAQPKIPKVPKFAEPEWDFRNAQSQNCLHALKFKVKGVLPQINSKVKLLSCSL